MRRGSGPLPRFAGVRGAGSEGRATLRSAARPAASPACLRAYARPPDLPPTTALDREADYDEVDEAAVGLWARQRGEAEGAARPPASTEVLEDNPWEQRCMQAEALGRRMPSPQQLALGALPAGGTQLQLQQELAAMETDGGQAAATAPAQQQSPRSALASRPRGESAIKKRVSFTGIPEPPQPWVPPHRRPGFVPRDPSAADAGAGAGAGAGAVQPSQVPDHVRHPERYTCYTLDQPIVVGGSVGQLAEGDEAAELLSAAAAAAATARRLPGAGGNVGGEAEAGLDAARWQGAVGGGIEFRARRQEAASRQPRQVGVNAAGPTRGSLAVGAQLAADEVVTEQQHDEEEQAGKARMQEDRQQSGQRRQRSLRSKPAAAMEDD